MSSGGSGKEDLDETVIKNIGEIIVVHPEEVKEKSIEVSESESEATRVESGKNNLERKKIKVSIRKSRGGKTDNSQTDIRKYGSQGQQGVSKDIKEVNTKVGKEERENKRKVRESPEVKQNKKKLKEGEMSGSEVGMEEKEMEIDLEKCSKEYLMKTLLDEIKKNR